MGKGQRPTQVQSPGAAEPVMAIERPPVRRSVDLSFSEHAELTAWCVRTAAALGTARITGQDVLRSLVARLLTDETLAREIRAELAAVIAQR